MWLFFHCKIQVLNFMSQQQTTNFILEFSTQFDSDTCNTICICLRNVESPDSAFLVQ